MKDKKNFNKAAIRKAKDIKHTYSETFVEPMDPCAKPDTKNNYRKENDKND